MTSILIRTLTTVLLFSTTVANASDFGDSAEVDDSYGERTERGSYDSYSDESPWRAEAEAHSLACAQASEEFESAWDATMDALGAYVECLNTVGAETDNCSDEDREYARAIDDYLEAKERMESACGIQWA